VELTDTDPPHLTAGYTAPALAGQTNEPVAWIGGVTAAVTSLVAGTFNLLQVANIIHLSGDQLAGLNTSFGTIVTSAGTIVGILLMRNRVKPMSDLLDHG
jgi:hypothetical protein